MSGARPGSLTVPVASPPPSLAPEGLESVSVSVSGASSASSSAAATSTDICVAPAAKVSVPLAAV